MERFLILAFFGLLVVVFVASSCTLSADQEDRERIDTLNYGIKNFQSEIFSLRQQISDLNVTLGIELHTFNNRLRDICESQDDIATIATSLEELEVHMRDFRERMSRYFPGEEEKEDSEEDTEGGWE